ncbi:hypothetical protein ACHAPT_008727 [Fusarium lateritium]
MAELSIVDASISEFQDALESRRINAVQLVAKYLHRLAQYDRRGVQLNSIPVLNTNIFEHAQESDEHRSRTGVKRSLLEGIPCTLKDSYMIEGLTVASGSPAFRNLTASEDAFTVSRIRQGGGIVIGKTNMPPMANGGMQRGLYGRAESPYNKDYLTAAYSSGSSNGAGSSTAAAFAAFGMAEETVSSGRSPASNNALVAYTPSRGILSIRGNWPLFPNADVVVPYARSVEDMLAVLDTIVAEDEDSTCDLWRSQQFVPLPSVSSVRPESYATLADSKSLDGKRIGVPKMYIGKHDPGAQPIWVCDSVKALWADARATLESLGAVVEEVGFPLMTNYEKKPRSTPGQDYPLPGVPHPWAVSGPPGLFQHAWDDFLRMVNDKNSSTKLADVDPLLIFPHLPGTLQDRYVNESNDREADNRAVVASMASRTGSILDIPGLGPHLESLEALRKTELEDWMDKISLDALVWPAAGDVAPQDAETNEASADFAWRNGVCFSTGNYVIRQLGIPTVTVPMGLLEDKKMPVGLTFASRAYQDNSLLSYGYAFEKAHRRRPEAPRTPRLSTDSIPTHVLEAGSGERAPKLTADAHRLSSSTIKIEGVIDAQDSDGLQSLQVYIDGVEVGPVSIDGDNWSVAAEVQPYQEAETVPHLRGINVPDKEKTMVVVVATAKNGRSNGKLLFE